MFYFTPWRLVHFFNSNESAIGSERVVLFGLLLCLFLRRTGNLWRAVGFHLGYDWGQTFFGVPDNGIVPYHNLLSSTFMGSRWLTGGMVGGGQFLNAAGIAGGGSIFVRENIFGCSGGNISPPLQWTGAPGGTKRFVVDVIRSDAHDDPSGWWHCIVYNLPATVDKLPKGAGVEHSSVLPPGTMQRPYRSRQ